MKCPITLRLMKDPVMCDDGHTYERSAIENWLQTHNTSPNTNAALEDTKLRPNHAMRCACAEWKPRREFADE